MRSRFPKVRSEWLRLLVLLASLGLSGCQVGRTFFQMDSNSRAPFMGLDLLPKRDRSSPTTGVSRFQNEPVVQSSAIAAPPEPQERETSRLSRLLGRSPEPERLSLQSAEPADAESLTMDAPVEDFR
ncbi:MAG: hypothetical protein KDA86_00155 [Planctomycetaceae bacterium]|nr:hypothetical protein [Planctomycetaceae bacterium]